MNWVSSWWSASESASAPPSDERERAGDAIELAADSIDNLYSKRMQIMKKSADLFKEAKAHKANGDAKRALACMKRRQYYDSMAAQMEGQLANLEKTSMAMESTATAVDLAQTMKNGSEVIKTLVNQVSIDDVEMVADDLQENMIDASELGSALARPLGGADEVDEDELLAEMNEWGGGTAAAVPQLPDLPKFEKKEEGDNVPLSQTTELPSDPITH